MRNSKNIKGFKIDNFEVLLSLYADDVSIFLEHDPTNLENVIKILTEFYHVSGLRIQLEKTQCITIGKLPRGDPTICGHLGLRWDQKFKLLGVEFDGLLNNIESNFELKLFEIRSVVSSWQYRFLTPIGRACVAKSLLLSKLSHLAFVIPSLSKTKLKKVEDEIYRFIWKGREKVSRDVAKLPETRGGLNFPDLITSWQAFKFSWIRRLITSKSSWKQIFTLNLSNSYNINLDHFLTSIGTVEYSNVAKKFPNSFWSECLSSISLIMREHLKNNTPEDIITYPLWSSNVFLRNNIICKRNQFGNIGRLATYPLDIISIENSIPAFISVVEFENKFNETPDFLHFTSIKLVIKQALQKHGMILENLEISFPFQLPLYKIANYSLKGCSRWVKMLRKMKHANENLEKRERLWETELGAVQGNFFWNKLYAMNKNIFFDNRLKWFNYQIIRGTLKTNRIICKFTPGITAQCTFCNFEIETISHLFFSCPVVHQFLTRLYMYFASLWPDIDAMPSLKNFVFGNKQHEFFNPGNLLCLYAKYYIWITRCKKNLLSLTAFISWFKIEQRINHLSYYGDSRFLFLNVDIYRLENI